MHSLWHWLKTRWLTPPAVGLRYVRRRAPPPGSTAGGVLTEEAYLRGLLGRSPWL